MLNVLGKIAGPGIVLFFLFFVGFFVCFSALEQLNLVALKN